MKTTKEEKVVEVPADVRMKFLHNGKSFTFEIDYELFSFIKRKRLKTKFLFNIKVAIKKDIIFYVERRPQESVRFAQMILRDKDEKEQGLPNIAYDLSTDEMELLLKEVGFDVDKVQIESEKHFVVWLARKNHISN